MESAIWICSPLNLFWSGDHRIASQRGGHFFCSIKSWSNCYEKNTKKNIQVHLVLRLAGGDRHQRFRPWPSWRPRGRSWGSSRSSASGSRRKSACIRINFYTKSHLSFIFKEILKKLKVRVQSVNTMFEFTEATSYQLLYSDTIDSESDEGRR